MILLITFSVLSVIVLQFCFKGESKNEKYHMSRRLQHFFSGAVIIFLYNVLSYENAQIASLIGFIFITSLTILRIQNNNLNQRFQSHFKHLLRNHEYQGFPGAFYFIAGVTFSFHFFPKQVSIFGIMLTTISDPTAALLGIFFNQSPHIWKDKNVAGTFGSSLIYATSCLIYFSYFNNPIFEQLGYFKGFLGCFILNSIIELIPFGYQISKYFRMDDNLFGMITACFIINIYNIYNEY